MSDGADKRRYPRVTLDLLVQYRVDTFEDFLSEYAANISTGGMFIETEEPRPVGTQLYFQFHLRDGTRLIEGLGEVVRVNPPESDYPGMGLTFNNLDADSRELIEAIVQDRLSERET